jgi:hypothetical protein
MAEMVTNYRPTCCVSYDAKPVRPENANAICDACGRYRHDNADDDAPSAYLTDETLDEIGTAMDTAYYAGTKYVAPELRLAAIKTLSDARAYVARNPEIAAYPGSFVGSYLADGYTIDKETCARLALILSATMDTHYLISVRAEKALS